MAQASDAPPPLRIGFVGSGFIAKFHAKSFQSVRHARIAGVYSPTAKNRDALAADINAAELGPCRAHDSLESLLFYIREHLTDFFESAELECKFEFPEVIEPLPLSADARRDIFMAVKETATNIVKHAGATSVHVQAR